MEPLAVEEDAVLQVVPKKANWDLKRDLQRKMKKLEPALQRSMIQLARAEEAKRVAAAEAAAAAAAGGAS